MEFILKLFATRLAPTAIGKGFFNGYGMWLLMLAPVILLIFILAVRASNKPDKDD